MNDKHRNDIYGDNPHGDSASTPAIPAATVVLLRESETGIETLMLHRTSKVSFGGMWVFPGGRIDPRITKAQIANWGPRITRQRAKHSRKQSFQSTPTHLPILRTGRHRLERQSVIQRIFSRASCPTKQVLRWMGRNTGTRLDVTLASTRAPRSGRDRSSTADLGDALSIKSTCPAFIPHENTDRANCQNLRDTHYD